MIPLLPRVSFRGLIPSLPRPVWILHAGMAVNYLGTGMFAPFLLIYLHNVRGLEIQTAGLVAAAFAGSGMLAGLVGGPMVDRLGARPTAALALVLLAAGLGSLPLVRESWHAFAFVLVGGVGRGLFWPGYSTLLIAATPADARAGSYAVQRVTANLGFGLGGLAAGLIVSTSDASTFTVIFLANAATYLVFLATLAFVPEPGRTKHDESAAEMFLRGGYREVLRDRAFVAAIAIGALFATFGIAQLNSTLPVFATSDAGVSERGIGLIFLANTLAILVLQLPTAKILQGRRRTKALAITGVLWAISWLLALVCGLWLTALVATIALIVVAVVFGIGECLLGVVQGPLVADLAPETVRGRYTALWLTTTQLGLTIGPAVGAFLLERSTVALWSTAAVVCLACGAAALLLERVLPAAALRTPVPAADVRT
jgi:MFS family permease